MSKQNAGMRVGVANKPCICAVLLFSVMSFSGPSLGQSTVVWKKTGAQVVDNVLIDLQRTSGDVITYEAPQYLFEGDLIDLTARSRYKETKPDFHYVIPKDTTVSVTYRTGPDGKPVDVGQVIQAVVRDASKGGIVYKAWQSGPHAFHVVVESERDVDGVSKPLLPLLDERISFPAKERTGEKFVYELCGALSNARHRLVQANILGVKLHKLRVTRGAENEKTRDLLERLSNELKVPMTWDLLCAPHLYCVLNLDSVNMWGFQDNSPAVVIPDSKQ